MEVLVALLLGTLFVLVLPALAIYTYTRVQQQARDLNRLSEHTYRWLTQRVYDLESKVATLEGRLAGTVPVAAPPRERVTPQPDAVQPSPPAPEPPRDADSAPAPRAPQVPARAILAGAREPGQRPTRAPAAARADRPDRPDTIDWESLIAGRWMNVVGIVALILAVAFFLRYAFESQWIGPAGRVAMGLFGGTVLLVASELLFRRGYAYFSEGIAGLAGGVLYLSLYAGWGYYDLFPQAVSFAGMVVVTAALMLLAAGRGSERIALVALAGGFLAPVLLGSGTDQQIVLFTYVAALDAGVLALARLRRWRLIEPVAFVATQLLFWGWYFRFWTPEKLVPTALFATLFFLLFSALPLERLRRVPAPAPAYFILVLTNAFAYLFALRAVLWPEHRWALTGAVLALAAVHVVVAQGITRGGNGRVPVARVLYAGLALAFATLAIPIRLEGRWIAIAWAIEGAVLVWSGFAAHVRQFRAVGLVLLAIVLYRLLASPTVAGRFLLNPRFMTLVIVAACLVAAVWFAYGRQHEYFTGEAHVYAAAAVTANVLLVWALTTEVWDAIGRMDRPLGMSSGSMRGLAMPLVWVVYGTALMGAGFVRNLPGLRWQGLPLVALAVGALLVQSTGSQGAVLNPRFFVYVVAAACILLIGRAVRQANTGLSESEQTLYLAVPVVLNVLLLVALSHEVWDLFGRVRAIDNVRYAQSMGLSLLWAGYATVLIVLGMRGAEPLLRWMALLLFGIVVVKVFFFDLSFLERGYRILSFFVLGVLLLGVSFLYTRRLAVARRGGSV